MLLSLKVGANGLTLVSANHCIFLEPWWNPCVHDQAQARTHRTGQKKKVYSVFIVIQGTIEERVLEICERKRALFKQVIKSDPYSRKNVVALDKESIRELLAIDDDDDDYLD